MQPRLIALFVGLALSGYSAALPVCPSAHFQPVTYYGQALGGAEVVTEHDVARETERYELQLVMYSSTKPAYLPIWVISVLVNLESSYRVVLTEARRQEASEEIEIVETEARLDSSLASRFVEQASISLLDTRYPESPCFEAWLDGYYLQLFVPGVPGYGDLAGEAYIPVEGSVPSMIEDVARALKAYVERSDSEQSVEEAVDRIELHNKSLKSVSAFGLNRTRFRAPLS